MPAYVTINESMRDIHSVREIAVSLVRLKHDHVVCVKFSSNTQAY